MDTADPAADRVAAATAQSIHELQLLPAAGIRVVSDVELADATNVYVAHKLGRRPGCVIVSAVRGALSAGVIRDVSDGKLTGVFAGPVDRDRYVVLRADGYGAPISVDLMVM